MGNVCFLVFVCFVTENDSSIYVNVEINNDNTFSNYLSLNLPLLDCIRLMIEYPSTD